MWLTENTGCKKCHLGTITQLCRAISSQLRHISTIRKNLLSSNVSPTRPYNMAHFGPLAAEILLASLGHPCQFQRISCLGSITARHSSIGRQPNFAALNRGRHLYSAGRPSRWTSAHILVSTYFARICEKAMMCLTLIHSYSYIVIWRSLTNYYKTTQTHYTVFLPGDVTAERGISYNNSVCESFYLIHSLTASKG